MRQVAPPPITSVPSLVVKPQLPVPLTRSQNELTGFFRVAAEIDQTIAADRAWLEKEQRLIRPSGHPTHPRKARSRKLSIARWRSITITESHDNSQILFDNSPASIKIVEIENSPSIYINGAPLGGICYVRPKEEKADYWRIQISRPGIKTYGGRVTIGFNDRLETAKAAIIKAKKFLDEWRTDDIVTDDFAEFPDLPPSPAHVNAPQ